MARDLVQLHRGLLATIPNLAQGEQGFTIDEERFYIGGLNGNVGVAMKEEFDEYKSETTPKLSLSLDVKYYGAIGDGLSHPLSERYPTLEDAQAVYSFATDLTNEIDWCATCKAIKLAILTKIKVISVPHGHYICNLPIIADFGGVPLSVPYVTAISIVGERSTYYTSRYGALSKETCAVGSVLEYTGDSGDFISTSGRLAMGFQVKDINLIGRGDYDSELEKIINTAKGLNLVGCPNFTLENVAVTGFDIGIETFNTFSGIMTKVDSVQNNKNYVAESSTNAVVFNACNFHQANQFGVVIETTKSTGTISGLQFNGCTLEGQPLGVLINPKLTTISDIEFNTPYFEVNDMLVKVGYDEEGAESLSYANNITMNTVRYSGTNPNPSFFKLNNVRGFDVNSSSIYFSAKHFDISDTVTELRVNGHRNSGFELPSSKKAIARSIQRKIPFNLIPNGNFEGVNFPVIVSSSATLTLAKSVDDEQSQLEITCASTNTLAYIEWRIYGANQLIGKSNLGFSALIKRDSELSVCRIGTYKSNGAQFGGDVAVNTDGNDSAYTNIRGITTTVPVDVGAYISVRFYIQNNSGVAKKVYLKSLQISTSDSGALVASPYDALCGNSGTVTVTTGAPTSVPITTPYAGSATNFRVLLTPNFEGSAYVTKGGDGTFTITGVFTSGVSGSIDYLVIPSFSGTIL